MIVAPGIEDKPEQREILRGYVRAEQAWIKAGMAPVDPDHPDLLATTAGAALAKRQESIRKRKDRGTAFQAPKLLRVTPRTVRATGATAEVELCFTQEVPVYNTQTGAVVDDDLFSSINQVTMELVKGGWVLTSTGGVDEPVDGETCRG